MKKKAVSVGILALLVMPVSSFSSGSGKTPALFVSDNGRFLVTEDGIPFFWTGDTSWGLIRKSSRDDNDTQPSVERYFQNRAAKGFNVLQVSITGSGSANFCGHYPFVDRDFSKPLTVDGPENDYWDHVDYIVEVAGKYGIYLALLPAWSNSIESGHPLETHPEIAYAYGNFLGQRYMDRTNIIWIMGGDTGDPAKHVSTKSRLIMERAMAEGIADGINGEMSYDGKADYSTSLMSYHPPGFGRSSSEYLHGEEWLDFNMIQTSARFRFSNYESVEKDYGLEPVKPTLESEVAYEYSLPLRCIQSERAQYGKKRISDWEVRKAAYWSVFAGGFGFTYGHRNFIGFHLAGDPPGRNGNDKPWHLSMDAPGAFDMQHLKNLMLSRPFLDRIPDQDLVVTSGCERSTSPDIRGTRDRQGSYAMIYSPQGDAFVADLSILKAEKVVATWYDPRVGVPKEPEIIENTGRVVFKPPSWGEGQDWVLILDDAGRNYPSPGSNGL